MLQIQGRLKINVADLLKCEKGMKNRYYIG